ncbi:MAG: helicase C-terminal domain-containing protein [Chlamydiota bacterium]
MFSKQELIDAVFSEGGALSRSLDQYDERIGQKEMARTILGAYDQDEIVLVEAGTGIGKSLAYLVPAVYWALKHQEKTVISTHTIALQEQLVNKDIPFLLKLLGIDLKACLVKGMSNYLCLRKMHELQSQPVLFSQEDSKEMQTLEMWSEKTRDGSRSDISFPLTSSVWEKVSADAETCNHVKCPHFKQCFFFKARKDAEESQLLIVNHHLLLADTESKRDSEKEQSIIPPFQRIVVDEAHHLEEVALESFAQKLDQLALIIRLGKLFSEINPDRSRLVMLRRDLSSLSQVSPQLIQKLEIDLPASKRECQAQVDETFRHVAEFFSTLLEQTDRFSRGFREKNPKVRMTPAHAAEPFWKETIVHSLLQLSEKITRLVVALQSLYADLQIYKDLPVFEKISVHLVEIQGITTRLEETSQFLQKFASDEPTEKRVRWFEMRGSHIALVDASLDVSTHLRELLFSRQRTSVLCSATITTARSFNYLKQRLGLHPFQEKLKEEIYDSPFDYAQRSLLVVPTDMPLPTSPDFNRACAEAMQEAIEISRGSVFLLFTSYEMLQATYNTLSKTLLSSRYPFLRQGDLPRHLLLEQFKKKEGNVLFATDSFWEGVDVPGEALRCVIIAKLPFSVPTDPLHEAYAQSLEKEGLNPFNDYSVPQAVIKFKQGFGRLMRKKEDRGCVICLDHRLVKKNYGAQFLKSLPPSRSCFGPKQQAFAEMKSFFASQRPGL